MRGGRGDGRGELVRGGPGHDLLPQVETSHVAEHTRSGFSMLECQGPNTVHLNLYPGLPEVLQPLLMPHPWMARGGNGE